MKANISEGVSEALGFGGQPKQVQKRSGPTKVSSASTLYNSLKDGYSIGSQLSSAHNASNSLKYSPVKNYTRPGLAHNNNVNTNFRNNRSSVPNQMYDPPVNFQNLNAVKNIQVRISFFVINFTIEMGKFCEIFIKNFFINLFNILGNSGILIPTFSKANDAQVNSLPQNHPGRYRTHRPSAPKQGKQFH